MEHGLYTAELYDSPAWNIRLKKANGIGRIFLDNPLGGVVMSYVHFCASRFLMNVCEKYVGHSRSYVQTL